MSRPQAAVAPPDRILIVSPAVRGTLLDLILNETRRLDKAREIARKHGAPRPMMDKRAAELRTLAAELAL